MRTFVWIIIGAYSVMNDQPWPSLRPAFTFSTEEQCEERLMSYMDDGFVLSRESSGRLVASRSSEVSKWTYMCASLLIP
jgi:hypothetical protein